MPDQPNGARKPWTRDEDAALADARQRRLTYTEIAALLGRSHAAVQTRARDLRLADAQPDRRRGGKRPAWTDEDLTRLRELRAQGLSATEIAAALGRTRQAVSFKAHELQLPRPETIRRGDPVVRFWAKVERRGPDECWLWLPPLSDNGYGTFSEGKRKIRAHRYAYEIEIGAIPDGCELLHSCDNGACVNPAHLRPGSHAENMADMVARGRQGPRRRRAR